MKPLLLFSFIPAVFYSIDGDLRLAAVVLGVEVGLFCVGLLFRLIIGIR